MKTYFMAFLFLLFVYFGTVWGIYLSGLWLVRVVEFFKLIFSETPNDAIRSAFYVALPLFPFLVVWLTNKFSDKKDLTK